MYEVSFYKLFNNISNIKLDYDKPINTLEKLNKLFCGQGIRIEESEINTINNEFSNILKHNKEKLDLYSISRLISLIQLKQIFYDGNHRTSILFFKILMNEFEPNFTYIASKNNDRFEDFFSIYYYDDDVTAPKCIENISKYIKR